MPLFLKLVGDVAAHDPDMARLALVGLRKLQSLTPPAPMPERSILARMGNATVRDYGGAGRPAVFVPPLINSAAVLDIIAERSLLGWLAGQGVRPLLVDWGAVTADMAGLDVSGYVSDRLVPLLSELGEPVNLVGYCLGGTMAMAAAQLMPVRSLTLIAAPWRFGGYPAKERAAMAELWRAMEPMARAMGLLPMEALQSLFWTLDPEGTVNKYVRLAELDPASDEAALFIAMEAWANGGEPLPFAAARELFEDLIAADRPGTGTWTVGGDRIDPSALVCPVLEIVSTIDRITPQATSADIGQRLELDRGHVGMITGGQAKQQLWEPLRDWLSQSHKD